MHKRKMKKTKLFGAIISDIIFWIALIALLVSVASNGGLKYLDTSSKMGVLMLPIVFASWIWKATMMQPLIKQGFKEKDWLLFTFGLITALTGGLVIEWILTYILVKSGTEFEVEDGPDKIIKVSAKEEVNKEETKKDETKKGKNDKVSILLTCMSAASSGILASKVSRHIKDNKIENVEIDAIPYGMAESTFNNYDVLLIAPQAGFKYNEFMKNATTAKVAKIPEDVYGRMNGEELLNLALEQLK